MAFVSRSPLSRGAPPEAVTIPGSSSSSTTSSSTSSSPSLVHRHHRHSGHSDSRHHCSTHKQHSNRRRKETEGVPLPHKVQHAIECSEFVDCSNWLYEHLTRARKLSKTKKATQVRHFANIDTWLLYMQQS